ncbi:PREDICTED: U-box domain-containing protein 13-like isoform X1 [Nelumbo nucifera]|uniref:RING-type E3 ubiquitin transferase n=1 Tax=Nelumbo nucifera TaxID=4432 RepID=A0A1U7ZKE3_NELNU|nr:PREDICTED: U-box domain-containing protein 13-like isoform X1 [Nelumbo nucifera]
MEEENRTLNQKLIDVVNEISAISDYRWAIKKQYCNLARRLKLLIPMFEEFKESKDPITEDNVKALISLKEALESTKEILRFGSEGSKIFLVLEREQMMNKFQEVTAQLEQALSRISYDKFDISDEVKEQVELVLSQFKRAKGRVDAPDVELFEDLLSVYNRSGDAEIDPTILRRLAEKLQLMSIADLKQESLALHEMVVASGGDPGENIEKMSMLLKKIKDFVQTEDPDMGAPANEKTEIPVIPDDFRCPISLELMKDPVIVSTGQTYERACIEKWLEAGHGTCPKTQQNLSSTVLTPNYVLRSLIAQWCEANGIEPPKRPSNSRPSKTASVCLPAERAKIDILLRKLTSGNIEDQCSAAGELRLLAKRNTDNRVCIAEAGAIPLLVGLLLTTDPRTQEHAVTALLNLSICEDNKSSIISSGAVPGIVHVLKKGSMETRENAAATLFSLSVVDENKVTIGASGAIPALVALLNEGSQRGKKDAATALFNLCIYQGNKGRAVRAGVVSTLMRLLTEPGGGMVDEALAVLAILASHPEGKMAIGAAAAVPVLVEVIGSGSPRNRENAAAVLVHLCSGDPKHIAEAQELGLMDLLLDLVQNGTDRGKRKAAQLLDRISRFVEQQKQAQAQAEAQTRSQSQIHYSESLSTASAIDG